MVSIDKQSADIALGVDKALESKLTDKELDAIGAGDQGMMFGYATNETDEYMPYPIYLAHLLTHQLTKYVRMVRYLIFDRTENLRLQWSITKKENRSVSISCSHFQPAQCRYLLGTDSKDIRTYVIDPILPAGLLDDDTKIYINPTGRFVIGGPNGDSGVTGRKIIVDTYGGWARHGGGAFSGKDPTKVDRSAAYAARYVAKNLVAAGLCDRAEIQLSYAIGVASPTSVRIDTFGTW